MERPDEQLIRYAEQIAFIGNGVAGYRVGSACAFRNSSYRGFNSKVSHPSALKFSKNPHAIYLHAEVAALIASKWRATQLVVIRLLADGSWGLAHPCTGCVRAIKSVGCECWYSTGVGKGLGKL